MPRPMSSRPDAMLTMARTTSFEVPCDIRVDKVTVAPAKSDSAIITTKDGWSMYFMAVSIIVEW